MRCAAIWSAMVLATALGGCGGPGPGELLDTAQFEEVQNNPAHARELYAEIVRRFPDSPAAATARSRLAALE